MEDNEKKPQQKQAVRGKNVKKDFNHMKRKNVEHGFAVISLMVMVPVFFGISLFLFVFPRSTVSNIEKRKLATFPEFSFEDYFSGKFTADIATYYDDTVPFRDDFKTAGYNFKGLFGIHTEEEVKVVGKPIAVVNKDKDESSKPSEASKPEQQTSANAADPGKPQESETASEAASQTESSSGEVQTFDGEYTVENGIIVVKEEGHYRALELFGGGTGNAYVNALNNINKDLGGKVQVYSMIAPLASEYYTPTSYSEYTASQKECFDSIASRLDDGIISVDIDTPLGQHVTEDIYLRTDHHWTPLGAYYAAQTFASAAKVDFKDLSTYKKEEIPDFVGTMYAFTGDANIKNDPEVFTYYKPDNVDSTRAYYYDTAFNYEGDGNFFNGVGDPSSAYLVFMGGDEQIVKVKTNVKNGKRLMIVKDSYGNAIPGYLFGAYEEIYVADMRYFQPNLIDFVQQNKVNDLLFAMVVYSAVGGNADNLETLRTQNKGQTIVDAAP